MGKAYMPKWWPEKNLGAAAAIFDEHGRVLLVKQSYGRMNWELPMALWK